MSKTKRNLIIIGSIVGVIVLLTIIFGSLFSIRTINVDYATTTFRVEEYSKEEILSKAKIKKNKNIIFYNFDEVEQNLEQEFPYAKFNIVRVFPSRVIIYAYERVPVFRILKNGFWFIFDEDLKCLEIVASANIGLNNNDKVPVLNIEDLELCEKAGVSLENETLKNMMTEIIDGVYGFEETPLSVMSDITLENNDILGTQVITMTLKESGTKIVVQGETYITEKIAYAVFVYASDVSQNSSYQGKLDQVTITVYKDFDLNNKQVVVNDGTS